MKKYYLLLFLIFLTGVILRFYKLGDVPAGFHRDEAFLGYNAYSILKTGKDMNGILLPLHLKSFLYSPSGYSYFSIPFIQFLDLTPFSVRFASAFFGSMTIILTFFLTKEFFSKPAALLSSFLIAISPWHINLSRTATENTLVVFFLALGFLLYLYWLKEKRMFLLILSFLFFLMTFFIYQAPRAFLPLFIPLIIVFSFKNIKRSELYLLVTLFLLTIIAPLLLILSSRDLSLRIRTVSFFSTKQTQLVIDEQIREDGVSGISGIETRVFHNKILGFSLQFTQNYFKHFSYDYFFTDWSFPERYRVPLIGLFYLIELPFLIIGLIVLLIKYKNQGLFLLAWILIVPIGSALTFDDIPNLQRTLLIFPAISIITAFGFLEVAGKIRKIKFAGILLYAIIVIFISNFAFYLHQYYIHVNRYRPWIRNDGYKELVSKVNKLLPNYKKAIITNHESAPTIFFLFFGKYSPSGFQNETKNTKMKDLDRIAFSKYNFSEEECPLKVKGINNSAVVNADKNVLYVNGGLCQVPRNANIVGEVKRGDGSRAFYILSSLPN